MASSQDAPVGCFHYAAERSLKPIQWNVTREQCRDLAANQGTRFYVLHNGNECILSNDMEQLSRPGRVAECPPLGKLGVNAVYDRFPNQPRILPDRQVGCLVNDPDDGTLAPEPDNGGTPMTFERCRDLAMQRGQRYYAMQGATDGSAPGLQCWLTNDFRHLDRGRGERPGCGPLGGDGVRAVYDRLPQHPIDGIVGRVVRIQLLSGPLRGHTTLVLGSDGDERGVMRELARLSGVGEQTGATIEFAIHPNVKRPVVRQIAIQFQTPVPPPLDLRVTVRDDRGVCVWGTAQRIEAAPAEGGGYRTTLMVRPETHTRCY